MDIEIGFKNLLGKELTGIKKVGNHITLSFSNCNYSCADEAFIDISFYIKPEEWLLKCQTTQP